MFTSVLTHYKKRFPDCRISLLVKAGIGLEEIFAGHFVDEILTVDYRAFAVNPFYGAALINRLRRIGFARVVSHDFSAAEIAGKMIAVGLGAREVVGYEGIDIEWKKPFDIQQERNLRIVKGKLFPRFTKLVESIDEDSDYGEKLRNAIEHHIAIYEAVTGSKESDYRTVLPLRGGEDLALKRFLKKLNLERGRYVLFNINTTSSHRGWPLARFAKVAELLDGKGLRVAVTGSSPADVRLAAEFEKAYWPKALNLVGKTSPSELVNLVLGSLFIFANDTSLVHIAIALAKPSICVVGGGQFGCFTIYGYPDINHWLWKRTECYFDDWHCYQGFPPGAPAPCVLAVPLSAGLERVESLLEYLGTHKSYPLREFSMELKSWGEASA